MKIIKAKKRKLDNQYMEERNALWEARIAEYELSGQPLWNGSVYYLDCKEEDSFYIELCEYKDLLLLEERGSDYLIKKYGREHVFTYLNVQILINYKDLYFFGTKLLENTKEIIPVGGTLRLENDEKIESFEDILQYAKKEVDIETRLDIEIKDLKFLEFVANENIGSFVFAYDLKNEPGSKILNIGEFDGEVCLDSINVFNSNDYVPSARLKSIKSFLQNLWKIR